MRNAVVFVADANVFPPAVFAAQRAAELNPRSDTDIFIFTDAEDELRAASARGYPFQVVPAIPPAGLTVTAIYFRLFIPPGMVGRYQRILYLDVDTCLENASPFALFDLDMRGRAVAAVRDYVIACAPVWPEINDTLGGRHFRYFNSGVMLIDCRLYADRQAAERMWQDFTALSKPPIQSDQSLLNRHFDGDFLELSPAFNMFGLAEGTPLPRVSPPAITHFVSTRKPWKGPLFGSAHPARAEMEAFFPQSPWPTYLRRFFDSTTKTPRGAPPNLARGFAGAAPIAHYLRNTEFADVTSGLTALHLDALLV